MKPETADYLTKAKTSLADAVKIAGLPLPHIAARETYVAVFHAAQAYIFEHTGKVAKTHRGVRSEFARLAKSETSIGRELSAFLATAYQFKEVADYMVGGAATPISVEDAIAAIGTAERFIETISGQLRR